MVTSELMDCHFLLWTMPVMSVNVPWCSLHSLHLCSSSHWNTPFLAQSPYSASCSCLLWWCEALTLSGSTSLSPGNISLGSVKALTGCPSVSCYISQTRKLQSWSQSVTPWSETWGTSMVLLLCPKASSHKTSYGHWVSEYHTSFSRVLGET